MLVLLLLVLPPLPAAHTTRLHVLGDMGPERQHPVGTGDYVPCRLAHFGTYTYVAPFLERVTHVGSGHITLFLLIYEVAGIVGNFLGGSSVARHSRGTFAAAAALIAGATLPLPVLGRWELGAVALLIAWGVGYGAVPVCSQSWFSTASPEAPEASTVLFTASFQATLSTGALVGGVVVDHTSPSTVMTTGGVAAVLMVLVVWVHHIRKVEWPETRQGRR
ncbi:hypothetical protein GCM10010289_06040 [Streptomyces violascens]|uniref:Uncharacterized protein n=1 Tax=Streptomyces violascens TaxID=67381 RepID=A0ABQ3QG74_9ACTN|nr:hypothetical protein GCM10010289_06040 [Streptomyces violascens]GHI36270.1 hypothetical protein Sviol_06780 [Streptomyces violascens]